MLNSLITDILRNPHRFDETLLFNSYSKFSIQPTIIKVKTLKKIFIDSLPLSRNIRVDYVEFLNAHNLTPIQNIRPGQTLVATAVFVGRTRLIDNIIIN